MLIKMSLPKESDPQSLVETQDPKEPLGKKKQSQTKPLLNWKVFLMILKGYSWKKQGCLINNLLNLAADFQNQKPAVEAQKISRGEWLSWRRSGFWCLGLAVGFFLAFASTQLGGALGLKIWAPQLENPSLGGADCWKSAKISLEEREKTQGHIIAKHRCFPKCQHFYSRDDFSRNW